MSDLISRERLLNDLNKFAPEHYNALVNDIIMKQPSAGIPTGKWDKLGEFENLDGVTIHVLRCSECGTLYRTRKLFTGDYVNAEFCPHCGADMKGEEND